MEFHNTTQSPRRCVYHFDVNVALKLRHLATCVYPKAFRSTSRTCCKVWKQVECRVCFSKMQKHFWAIAWEISFGYTSEKVRNTAILLLSHRCVVDNWLEISNWDYCNSFSTSCSTVKLPGRSCFFKALLNFILKDCQPLSIVENEEFKETSCCANKKGMCGICTKLLLI